MMRDPLLFLAAAIILALLPEQLSFAQQRQISSEERVVICMIRLEHADAENLAAVLNPFLSPQGSIAAYAPTNTLIIKDRVSIVDMLAEIVKGKPCITAAPQAGSDAETGLD